MPRNPYNLRVIVGKKDKEEEQLQKPVIQPQVSEPVKPVKQLSKPTIQPQVFPTIKPVKQLPKPAMQQQVYPTVIPVLIPPANVTDFFDANSDNYQGRYNKKRRNRKRKRERKMGHFNNKPVLNSNDFRWLNPNISNQNTYVADAPLEKETEELEVALEVPLTIEEDFEEVEVASSEGDGKKIPVGFRKTKLCYLNYKKRYFFKPKFYNFSSQRTVVNCLNVDDDVSVDVDVVSEAEYDEYEVDTTDPTEKIGTIIEIEDEDEEETIHDVNEEVEEESTHVVTDEIEESTHAVSDKVDEESNHVVEETDKKSAFAVNEKVEQKSTCSVTNEVNKISCTVADEVNKKLANVDLISEVKKETICNSDETTSKTWISKGIEGSDDLTQGKSLIQDKLDAWESHLIGLEYMLEICDKNKILVLKYYCVLCDEEIDVQELPEVYVINHVSGCNHVAKYLEKHFPTCGYTLNKNNSHDFVVIQKLCETVNKKLGYYFMCIANNDYYTANKLKIKKIIQNAFHLNENDFKFEKNTFEQKINSDLSESINNVIEDVIKKIIPENKDATSELSKGKGNKGKLTNSDVQKKPAESKSRPKHKGNNPVSAYLRLSFAAGTKLKPSSDKATSNKNKKAKPNKEQVIEDVKPHDEKIEESVKPKNDQIVESSLSKTAVENTELKTESVVETVEVKVEEPENVIELIEIKEEQHQEGLGEEAQNIENSMDNSATVQDHEVSSNVINTGNKKIFKNKEKVLLKTTVHSKHCRKRILDKGLSRLMLAAKTTAKRRLVTEVSNKSNVKPLSVTEKVSSEAPKGIIAKTIKPESKENKMAVASHKKKPSFKVISVQQTIDSKSPVTGHVSLHQKSVQKKSNDNIFKDEVSAVANDTSHWIPMKASSPILTSDISLFLKKIASGQSENPIKKRRVSKSPVRKIDRIVSKSHSRRYSKSPRRKRDSKSPVKNRSRSPHRKSSKSPRRSRSPVRRRSRSIERHRSRSPRRRSRSPRRRSRSPLRRRSRSPFRRHSRSPGRRSRSPGRLSRSPGRRSSRSPGRSSRSPVRRSSRSPRRRSRSSGRRSSRSPDRRSRSPTRRYSRSPFRRHSRSLSRRHSRSPIKRRSRSPHRRYSRSPIKRRSRSPIKNRSRSPYRRHSRSPNKFSGNLYTYINKTRQIATNSSIRQSSSSRDYFKPDDHYHRNAFNFGKHLNLHESEIPRSRDDSKMLHSSKMNKSDRYKSQTLPSVSAQGISDLDPVSDEDESIYFSDKHLRSEDIVSPASKLMLSKLFQKCSASEDSSDPALNNLLQFMENHRAEIEEFIALKSTSKSEKSNTMKIDSNFQQQTLLLQQFLLANLAGSMQDPGPSVSNIQYAPSQQPFLPDVSLRFAHPSVNLPTPATMTQVPPQPAPMQSRFFPPNVNVPPPQLFQHNTQPIQDYSPKPKPPSEVMFKDLKATVSKLFGANESVMKQNIKSQMPGFANNPLPDPEKWDLNQPNTSKFNVQLSPKNVFSPSGKGVGFSGSHENPVLRQQISSPNTNSPAQFFTERSNERSRIPSVPVPPPDAKVTFCDSPRNSSKGNLFPVVNPNLNASTTRAGVNDVKVSLAQRLASVLVKIGMVDVPAPLLQEMLMKIGAFSSSPRQDISENEILSILKRLGYLS